MTTLKIPCLVYSRIVGYIMPLENWNDGKLQEWQDRKVYKWGEDREQMNEPAIAGRGEGTGGTPAT